MASRPGPTAPMPNAPDATQAIGPSAGTPLPPSVSVPAHECPLSSVSAVPDPFDIL